MKFNQPSTLPKQSPITVLQQIATLGKHNRHLMRQEPSPTDANRVPNKRQEHDKQQVKKTHQRDCAAKNLKFMNQDFSLRFFF